MSVSAAGTAGTAGERLFSFAQFEFPWSLGPSDGRYLLRLSGDAGGPPTHVIVIATLGAPERRHLTTRRRPRAEPEPAPVPVATGRATVIDVAQSFSGPAEAVAWLRDAGEQALEDALGTLNRALHAFRLVTADPYVQPVTRRQAIVARLGYGVGEQVADGLWTDAREPLPARGARSRRARSRVLQPQERLAAMLGAREPGLVCEELVLRARLDLDHARPREAALQLLIALDAAVAELSADPRAGVLAARVTELRDQREPVAGAAQSALTGALTPGEQETVEFTVGRIEAALRARVAAGAPT